MTLEQTQKVRRDKPREFDTLVAEYVTGNIWAIKNGEESAPKYHCDANADLESHRVACGWIFGKRMNYLRTLYKIWLYRFGTQSVCVDQLIIKYQIGDYSVAALSVVFLMGRGLPITYMIPHYEEGLEKE